ncbi:hypothetical protein WA026_000636 [Henosepilachna vigintioctopunctata]|uniref:Uncharacterized protein n=1 Tax=Henosepilachna vigintioctopunctata TaxID=420089 RepID=A0AAW1V125_9CUCU
MCRLLPLSLLIIFLIFYINQADSSRSLFEVLQPLSIEYKYIQRNILPREHIWWKRGTHHDIDTKSPVIVVRP